jgi:hypothetical protein
LQREEELLFDMDDRIKNLPVTLRSYEKREEYLEVMEEIKAKVNELKEKAKEMKEKMYQDEREMSQIMRGPRKKEHAKQEQRKQEHVAKQKGPSEKPKNEKNPQVVKQHDEPKPVVAATAKSTLHEEPVNEVSPSSEQIPAESKHHADTPESSATIIPSAEEAVVKVAEHKDDSPSSDVIPHDESNTEQASIDEVEVVKTEIKEPVETVDALQVTENLVHTESIAAEESVHEIVSSIASEDATPDPDVSKEIESLENAVADADSNAAPQAESNVENETNS